VLGSEPPFYYEKLARRMSKKALYIVLSIGDIRVLDSQEMIAMDWLYLTGYIRG